MSAFIASFIFVVLAEMGDKTQLLAMAFAACYRADKVLIAVFIATLLNHALAVVAGRFLATVMPFDIISFAAALSFVGFGLWTLHGDKLKDEAKCRSRYGPILTVAIAFFLAEMGDKTQLATMSLAVKYQNAFAVLMGTTIAMVVADSIGIIAGVVMHKHIPEKAIKWVSAIIFILFGLSGVYKILSVRIDTSYAVFAVLCISAGAAYVARRLAAK